MIINNNTNTDHNNKNGNVNTINNNHNNDRVLEPGGQGLQARVSDAALVPDRNVYISTNQYLQHLIQSRYTVFNWSIWITNSCRPCPRCWASGCSASS